MGINGREHLSFLAGRGSDEMKDVVTRCARIRSDMASGTYTCVKVSASRYTSHSASTTFSPPRNPTSQ